jgi:hypothetical protein
MDRRDRTVTFLRMAAIELRRLAEAAPEISGQLLHVAKQLETEADELAANPQP